MKSAGAIFALLLGLALPAAGQAAPIKAPALARGESQTAAAAPKATNIDGIAVRIGDDVVTESEVRQLEDYQQLIDGKAESRALVLQELVDQWIVRTEATATKFPHPTASEVSQEGQTLVKQFKSPQEFQERLAHAGLTQDELRQVIERQLYYVRFLNYKFHAVSQVTSAEIEAYYQKQLAPQLEKKGLSVPPLNRVEAQIRQLLTQEEISKKAEQWLEEAKARLRIVIQPSGGGG